MEPKDLRTEAFEGRTADPWEYDPETGRINGDGGKVYVGAVDDTGFEVATPDGRLMAAAPALLTDRDRLAASLRRIANSPHCHYDQNEASPYGTGVADGHRCAAQIARDALASCAGTPAPAKDANEELVEALEKITAAFVKAVASAVDFPGFDPETHVLVVKARTALAHAEGKP